ncbi:MAG: Rieske (2Fe-2S) protein [Deltaproteobacteria bacterium]|nr:Rieske (2Fe-2S) protein [Candidatus Anaeroferrophillus wilburensis]MBN2887861.1 Rieske (2Fe-2S) protein [Deltaproteobacteria bacterium]
MTLGLAASLGTGVVYSVKYLVPAKKKATFIDVLIGNLKELPSGTAKEFIDGQGKKALLINNGQEIKAFSKICTHLGCEVDWHGEKKQFYCPCHEGFFDANGNVLAGPPPRPLDEYKVTVKGENIFVALKEV